MDERKNKNVNATSFKNVSLRTDGASIHTHTHTYTLRMADTYTTHHAGAWRRKFHALFSLLFAVALSPGSRRIIIEIRLPGAGRTEKNKMKRNT